jgi:hypothetical protein
VDAESAHWHDQSSHAFIGISLWSLLSILWSAYKPSSCIHLTLPSPKFMQLLSARSSWPQFAGFAQFLWYRRLSGASRVTGLRFLGLRASLKFLPVFNRTLEGSLPAVWSTFLDLAKPLHHRTFKLEQLDWALQAHYARAAMTLKTQMTPRLHLGRDAHYPHHQHAVSDEQQHLSLSATSDSMRLLKRSFPASYIVHLPSLNLLFLLGAII